VARFGVQELRVGEKNDSRVRGNVNDSERPIGTGEAKYGKALASFVDDLFVEVA
jgi:hypothetical protein